MTTTYTLTGRFADLLGANPAAGSITAWVTSNIGSLSLNDQDLDRVRLPARVPITVAADGSFSVTLIGTNSTGTNVADGSLRYQVEASYLDGLGQRQGWSSGQFDLTANADLSDKAGTASGLTVDPSSAALASIVRTVGDPRYQRLSLINTAAGWTSANTVLALGEVGHESDTGRTKTGDGTTAWTALAYDPFLAPDWQASAPIKPLELRVYNGLLYRRKTGTPSTTGSTFDAASWDRMSPGPDVQVFNTSGTWSLRAGATVVIVEIVGAGSGGGAGFRGAAGTARGGGGSGAPGGYARRVFLASDLPATCPVTVGAGGLGGASATVNDSGGGDGTVGGNTLFGPSNTGIQFGVISSTNTNGKTPVSAGVAGAAGGINFVPPVAIGGSAGSNGTAGSTAGGDSAMGIAGSSGGGGLTATNTLTTVANSGAAYALGVMNRTIAPTADGAAGVLLVDPPPNTAGAAVGATGGMASVAGKGGDGSRGAIPGGGGGGGGASSNGNLSGKGGDGGQGRVVVTTYF